MWQSKEEGGGAVMVVGLVRLLVGFVATWEAVELVLRHDLLLSALKLVLAAALAIACIAIIFLAKALSWVPHRTVKFSIGCRSCGFNYLRDITISSPKATCEICKQEKTSPGKPTSASLAKAKAKSKGQTKWRLITNVASLLSFSVVELSLKAPKAALGIKDLKIDLFKTGELDPVLNVEIHLIPLFVQALQSDDIDNNTSVFNKLDWWVGGEYCSAMDTSDCCSFLFKDIALLCKLH